MSCIEKRIENLGIELPVRDRKGKGAVSAVLDGDHPPRLHRVGRHARLHGQDRRGDEPAALTCPVRPTGTSNRMAASAR